MALTIIKPSTKLFTMECKKCECIYTYELSDIRLNDTVECPECHASNLHADRKPSKIQHPTVLIKQ